MSLAEIPSFWQTKEEASWREEPPLCPAMSFKFWNVSKDVPSVLDYSEGTLEKGSFLKVGHRLLHYGARTSPNVGALT